MDNGHQDPNQFEMVRNVGSALMNECQSDDFGFSGIQLNIEVNFRISLHCTVRNQSQLKLGTPKMQTQGSCNPSLWVCIFAIIYFLLLFISQTYIS